MELTSRQRRVLDEADMSRRDFLKLTGKAAAGAAAPQSLLKGLIPGTETKGLVLPKNQAEMVAALLKWAKDSGNYQDWYNKCVTWYSSPHSYWYKRDQKSPSKEEVHQKAVDRINEWADYTAWAPNAGGGGTPVGSSDIWNTLNWVLWNGQRFKDDPELPGWVTAYRLSQWSGKNIGLDHPLVKDREKWDKVFDKIHFGRIDNQALVDEFKNIIQSTLPQSVSQEMISAIKPWKTPIKAVEEPELVDDDEGDPDMQPEVEPEEPKQEEQPSQIPTDEPDAWRTQSVEFENKLRRLVR